MDDLDKKLEDQSIIEAVDYIRATDTGYGKIEVNIVEGRLQSIKKSIHQVFSTKTTPRIKK